MRVPATRVLGALVFDFDHTLTDFGRGVDWQSARHRLITLYESLGVDTERVLRERRSLPIITALDRAVTERHSAERAQATRVEACGILDAVELAGAERASLLPGALAAFDAAERAGLRLGIVSANAERAIRAALGRLGVVERFDAIVGRDPCRPMKPEPDMHHEVLRLLGCSGDAAVGIGDSTNDVRAALAAGMIAVGVTGGESAPDALFAAGATFVLADLTAVPPLLALWHDAARDG